MFLRLGSTLVLLAALSALPGAPAQAATDDRKSLVVGGRVTDRDGWPVERAKISARGDRTASTTSDEAGRFRLEIPLGTPAALARGAFEFTIEARAGGARLALADGRRELRLGLRLIGAPGEEARVEVRASEAEAAAAVAHAFAQQGTTPATLVLVFVPATTAADGPAELSAREEAPLPGVKVPGAKPTVSERAAPDTAGAAQRERERRQQDAREREAAERGARERDAREKQAAEKTTRDKQRIERMAAERSTRERQRIEKQAAEKSARERQEIVVPERAKPAGDGAAHETPDAVKPGAQLPPSGKPRSITPAPAPPVAARPAPSSAQKPAPRTPPTESGATAKGPAGVPPPVVAERTAPAPCGCRIEGTIEVQSDRPLSHRLPLILRLRDQPACRDTVELFMGSPRVFEITGAGCGPHVIDVEIPARERFRLANSESERRLSCVRGVLRQFRLILLPR